MKIAIVCPGDSLHVQPWVDELAGRGHGLVVYAYPPLSHDFGSVTVVEIEATGVWARAMWLRERITAGDFDLVTMHYAGTDAYALSRLGVPLVVSTWGSDVLRDLAGWPKRVLVSAGLRRALLVVTPSQHMAERLTELGVHEAHIFTRQYGVDTDQFSPDERMVAEAPVRVVCTRGMKPVYGNADLVEAAALVDRALVDEVVFTGRGPLKAELERMARDSGVADRVTFLGGVDRMEDALREADIYCSMSRSDGVSLSLLEAMSCGLPVVVSDIPANREWVRDGENGYLVPVERPQRLAERLSALAADPSKRDALGRAARQTVLQRGDRRINVPAIIDAVEAAVSRA